MFPLFVWCNPQPGFDDWSFSCPPSPELPFPDGEISQKCLERLQSDDFLWALTNVLPPGGARAEESKQDPPDQVLICGADRWGLELTQLTIEEVRRDFSQVRAIGVRLKERLNAAIADYPHLVGRQVHLQFAGEVDTRLVRRMGQAIIDGALHLLKDDRGVVGEGIDLSCLPNPYRNRRGFYGRLHGATITVQGDAHPDQIHASAAPQIDIYRKQVLDHLHETAVAKDKQGNDLVLITCGLPSRDGYTIAADIALFDLWVRSHDSKFHGRDFGLDFGGCEPKNIKSMVLHDFQRGRCANLWRAPGAVLPWDGASKPSA